MYSAICERSDFIVHPCGVPGGMLAKSPRIIVQRFAVEFELDFAAEHEERRVTAAMEMPRHGGAGATGERRQLVDVGRIDGARGPRHDLAADGMVLARIGRQHVHAPRTGQPADDRPRLGAAHLDWIEDVVGGLDGGLKSGSDRIAAECQSEESRRGRQSRRAQKRAPATLTHLISPDG